MKYDEMMRSSEGQGVKPILNKFDQEKIMDINQDFIRNKHQIQGVDPRFKNDTIMYEPVTDCSIALDFKKEYVRHKRVLCSIKEFLNFDI